MALDDPHYQAAPWTLRGEAIVGLKLVRADIVRRFIPPDAKVLCVWPKRTLAVLYLAQYRQSPVGEYRELIIAPALVSRAGRVGFWISHIYVDSVTSLVAGRALWALPKQMASIEWTAERIAVIGPQVKLQAASAPSSSAAVRLPFIGAAMSKYRSAESWFAVRGAASCTFARATVDLAGEGLDELGFGGTMKVWCCRHLRVTIGRATKLK
jgi:hypothetical protein